MPIKYNVTYLKMYIATLRGELIYLSRQSKMYLIFFKRVHTQLFILKSYEYLVSEQQLSKMLITDARESENKSIHKNRKHGAR